MTEQTPEPENLSWASVVSRRTLGNLTIPPTSLEEFYERVDSYYMLVVFTPQAKSLKIEVMPVDSKVILKLQLMFESFTQEIFKEITKILQDLKLDRIYTSGVCLRENLCVYEAYLEEAKLPVDKEEVLKLFKSIPGIKDAQLNPID